MFLGTVAVLKDDSRMTKKYLGMSPIDYFIKTKARFENENFALVVENGDVYKLLANAFDNVLLDEGNEGETLKQAANFLGTAAGQIARKAQQLHYGSEETGIQVFVVFSDEEEKADNNTYMRIAAFINMIEQIYSPSAHKSLYRLCINGEHENNGVEFIDENAAYIDATVKIGAGCTIYPNVFLEGDTEIGENTVLYPGCRIVNSRIGNNCALQYVVANEAVVEDNVTIGPFVNLRPNTVIKENCKIGDFVEVKNSTVGRATKLPHLSYIGDANVGERVNVGCGTVFVNYDGKYKHRTSVGNDVFIGCNSNLVAPISVGDNVYVAAGSTLTDSAPDGVLAIARARQVNKEGWLPPYKRTDNNS